MRSANLEGKLPLQKPKARKKEHQCDCCGRMGEYNPETKDAACEICAALECDACREVRILMDKDDGELTYEDLLSDDDEDEFR